MKKRLFCSLLLGIICFTLVGCGKTNDNITLMDIYYKVGIYFSDENADRSNLSANYIDSEQGVVVVRLIENSKEKQESFLKNAEIDFKYSKFIQFEQGGTNVLTN